MRLILLGAIAACPSLMVTIWPTNIKVNFADLSLDGSVDGQDLAILLEQWGTLGTADFDFDGVVGASDLGILLAEWK